MKTKGSYLKLVFAALLILVCSSSIAFADCLEPHAHDDSDEWTVTGSFDHQWTDLESIDLYLSGAAGTEDWRVVHDLSGDLNGFTIGVIPPILGKRVAVDVSYLEGTLGGSFNTQEITPTPEGPYTGSVEFDRQDVILGVDVYVLNAVYGRLQYHRYEMDGTWVYDIVTPNEPQEYEYQAITIGGGFKQNYDWKIGDPEDRKFGFVVDAFFGLVFIELEHTEVTAGVTQERDDVGFIFDGEFLTTYQLGESNDSYAFLGVGVVFSDSDDNNLDLTQQGITGKAGVNILF